MIKILLLLTLSTFVTTAQATSCESQSYQITIQDTTDSCMELILSAAKENGCDEKALLAIKENGQSSGFSQGSSTFCKIISTDGHYQVMTDHMPEPPVATIYFSRFD